MLKHFRQRIKHAFTFEHAATSMAARAETPPPEQDAAARAVQQSRALYGDVGLHDAARSGWFNQATQELFTGFAIDAGDTVVDVGCGSGGNLKFCARFAKKIIGIDIDPNKIELAKTTLTDIGHQDFELIASDTSPIPLANQLADRVICTEVLEHVDSPEALMQELHRIGKPGALYLISVPGQLSEELLKPIAPKEWFEHPNHIRIFTPESFTQLVSNAGLVIENQGHVGFYWAIWHALLCLCNVEHQTGAHPALDRWAQAWDLILADPDSKRRIAQLDQKLYKSHIIIARKPTS